MAINYGLLDTSTPEKLGAIPSNALAKYIQTRQQIDDRALAREHAGMQNALVKMHLTQGERAMAEEDAYKAALSGVQNGDYTAAMPDLMKVSPARALALKKNIDEGQKAGVEATLKRFELIDRTAAQFAANPTRQTGVWVLSQLAANGTPPAVIQQMSEKLNAARDEDLPQMAQAFLSATQEGAKAHLAQMFPKPPQPTDLGRLIAERDALPAGDPRRAAYEQAINKATTHAPTPAIVVTGADGSQTFVDPRNPKAPGTPVLGPDGKPVVKPKTQRPLQTGDKKTIDDLAGEINALSSLEGQFRPEFAGGGPLGGLATAAYQKIGSAGSSSMQRDAAFWADFSRLIDLPQRNAIFGASLSVGEKASWEGAKNIRPGTAPELVKAKLAEMRQILGRKLQNVGASLEAEGYDRDAIRERSGGLYGGAPSAPGVPASATPPAQPAGMDSMPPPAEHVGRTIRDSSTGVRYRSDGSSWVRVQ